MLKISVISYFWNLQKSIDPSFDTTLQAGQQPADRKIYIVELQFKIEFNPYL